MARQAVLILGASGSGKSGLALEMMAMGAELVADDQVLLTTQEGVPHAFPPKELAGRIEARGIGIIRAKWFAPVPVVLAVDLSKEADGRMPERAEVAIAGHRIPVIFGMNRPSLAPALLAILKGGLEDVS